LLSSVQIQTLDIPGEVKAGYSPIGFVRCGRSACKITKIDWKVGGAGSSACWLFSVQWGNQGMIVLLAVAVEQLGGDRLPQAW
jgi:hypothetical protein